MNVRVEPNRFLSVACEPDERIVFDRKETKYHLLRDTAAKLWDEICEGGTFEVAQVSSEGPDPISQLVEAGLIGLVTEPVGESGMTRRVWLGRTGKASAAAVVLPLVATIVTPRLALGQVPGPSLEEELTGLEQPSVSEPLLDSPQIEEEKKQKEDKGTRTRTRTRTRQSSETSAETTGTRTRRQDG